jgi:hypothetical protein
MAENPFGRSPFGTAPFGPSPEAPYNASIRITANAIGASFSDAVGEAAIDVAAAAVDVVIYAFEAGIELSAAAVSEFSRARVRVITTAPYSQRGVTGLSRPTVAASQHSGRSRTGISHTGLHNESV